MSEKWTPGPWRYDAEEGFCSELIGADGSEICVFVDEDTSIHDINLMIAAPDLYEALKSIEWGYEGCLCPECENGPRDGHNPECKLNAAIKKARGEE